MAEPREEPAPGRPRRDYVRPALETVEVVADEALLAECAFSSSSSGTLFAGAPCSACFISS